MRERASRHVAVGLKTHFLKAKQMFESVRTCPEQNGTRSILRQPAAEVE